MNTESAQDESTAVAGTDNRGSASGWIRMAERRSVRIALMLMVALLAIGIRFVHIGADPPPNLSWSQDVLTDPPQYSCYARDAVVFGDWNPLKDDKQVFFLKNVTGLLCYAAFLVAGPSIASANATAAILSLLTILFLAWGTARAFGWWAGFAAATLLASDFVFVGYGRQPFLEVASNATLAFAFWAIISSRSRSRWWLLAVAGFVAGAGTFFGKVTALHAFPPFLLAASIVAAQSHGESAPRRWAGPISFAGAFALVGLLWYLFAYRVASAEVFAYLREQSSSLYGSPLGFMSVAGFVGTWYSFGYDTGIFTHNLVIGVAGFVAMAGMMISEAHVASWRALCQRVSPAVVLVVGWFLCAYAAFSPFNYRPVRYQVVLLLPLAAAAGWLIERMTRTRTREAITDRVSWWVLVPLTIVLSTAFQQFVAPWTFASRESLYSDSTFTVSYFAGLAIGALVILVANRTASLPRDWPRVKPWFAAAAAAILLYSAVDQSRYFAQWWKRPSYAIQAIGEDLAKVVGPGAAITGGWAPTLRQGDAPIRCLVHMFALQEPEGFFERMPITHVVIEDKLDSAFPDEYPDLAFNSEVVAVYSVRDLRIIVLRVAGLTGNPEADAYQLTPFERMKHNLPSVPQDSLFLHVSRFVADSASHYTGWAYLADLYARVDSIDAALNAYEHALEFAPDDYVLLAEYGHTSWLKYRTDGGPPDRERAVRLFHRALDHSPNNTLIHQWLQQAQQ